MKNDNNNINNNNNNNIKNSNINDVLDIFSSQYEINNK